MKQFPLVHQSIVFIVCIFLSTGVAQQRDKKAVNDNRREQAALEQQIDSIQKDIAASRWIIDSIKNVQKKPAVQIVHDTVALPKDTGKDAGELHKKTENLREDVDALKERIRETKEELREEMRETKTDLSEAIEEKRKDTEERNRHRTGGAGVFTAAMLRHDTEPLKKLGRLDKSLASKKFNFDHRETLMLGLLGYRSAENGVRLGSGAWLGYKRYDSEPKRFIIPPADTVDSVTTLRVVPAYVGFVAEKALPANGVTLFSGFMIGGGAIMIFKTEHQYPAIHQSTVRNESTEHVDFAYTPAFAWDGHAGVSVSLAPAFQVGMEFVLLCAYALDGFGPQFESFLSVNPSIRLRLSFGKEGF